MGHGKTKQSRSMLTHARPYQNVARGPEFLRILPESARVAGVKIKRVLLDQEFFARIIVLLQRYDIQFLTPCSVD